MGRLTRESDCQFDLAVQTVRGFHYFCECKFTKGTAGVRGAKPCPDGILRDIATGEVFYVEMKRPSECASNSWLCSYRGDRLPVLRKSAKRLWKQGQISRVTAEAHIIIAEHDEHMSVRGPRWQDPLTLHRRTRGGNVIVLPETETDRINAVVQVLESKGRLRSVVRGECVCLIFFNVVASWQDAELRTYS